MNRRPFPNNFWLNYTVLELIVGTCCLLLCCAALFALATQL